MIIPDNNARQMESKNALGPGTQVKSPSRVYTIVNVLGTGAYGITYLATTQDTIRGELGAINVNVNVTLKEFFMEGRMTRTGDVVNRDRSNDEISAYARCFYLEADKLSILSHPNIVNVLEVFVTNNTCYYSMEYLSGGSLSDLIQENDGLPEAEALKYIKQIGDALSYMHSMKMLHLDIKPANIVFDDNHVAKIIDYGLSQQYESNGESESSDGLGAGTPGYASLEQSSKEYGIVFAPTLDVYSLGATYYKMLTACTPPKAVEILDTGINTLPLVRKNVSQQSIDAIKAAMQPMVDKRLQTVDDFLAMLPFVEVEDDMASDKAKKKKLGRIILLAGALVIVAIVVLFLVK